MVEKKEINLPLVGKIPVKQVAFCAAIAVLAVVEVIEWPIAAVLATGHLLAHSHLDERLQALGEGMEEAG